jgi:hypothetical protein
MTTPQHIAKHLREVFFGGNWTTTNVKDTLADVTWQQAIQKVEQFNTIATLAFHISYFVSAVIPVLKGKQLTANDKYSFDHPPIGSQDDWEAFLKSILADAERLAALIEKLPESTLWEDFTDKKYGSYYRNFHGIIEHTHYHLGQIVILKKLLQH